MEKSYPRKLIAVIGGYRELHENRKAWLVRVAQTAGISVRQAYKAFYEEYASQRTQEKLQQAARQRKQADDSELILRIHAHIRYLETVDPEMYRADIDAARRFLAHYQDFAGKTLLATIPPGVLDDC